MSNRMARMDFGLFCVVLLMLGFGIVIVYSSSFALSKLRFGGSDVYLSQQAIRAILALASFMFFINVDYHIWGKLGNAIYFFSVILLIAVLIPSIGEEINGARRWISIGPVRFQVSELARMALIMVLARNCEKAGPEIKKWPVLSRCLVLTGIMCALILKEPNYSTSFLLGITALAILFLSGANILHLAGVIASLIPIAILLILKEPYRLARIQGFMKMSSEQNGLSYQATQSVIGLGNGGLFGVGIGKGAQKFFYLPEPHTDFAISIIGEEIGFIGLMILLAMFVFIVYRGLKISLHAPDKLGQMMAFGFTFVVASYTLTHIFVGTAMMPTTGIPLPFLSYGGMSLIFMMSSMGILLNISSQARYGLATQKNRRFARLAEV
ncbi:MAG: cell division protein FtsW [Fibrobacter sp.]|jgi:cell division protein FtsW|nr:cell division protein FtsW [Fibrobacter sp.]